MADDASVCRTGLLRKVKTNKDKFFVLHKDGHNSPARLEYYDKKMHWEAKKKPRKIIPLQTCFSINTFSDSKTKFGLTLYTKDDSFQMSFEGGEERDTWDELMRSLIQRDARRMYQHVWNVRIPARLLGKNFEGDHRLCLNDRTVMLVKKNSVDPVVVFPLEVIRRCGHTGSFFNLEVGRSATTGPGEFWMQVDDTLIAENVYHAISSNMSNSKDGAESALRIQRRAESSRGTRSSRISINDNSTSLLNDRRDSTGSRHTLSSNTPYRQSTDNISEAEESSHSQHERSVTPDPRPDLTAPSNATSKNFFSWNQDEASSTVSTEGQSSTMVEPPSPGGSAYFASDIDKNPYTDMTPGSQGRHLKASRNGESRNDESRNDESRNDESRNDESSNEGSQRAASYREMVSDRVTHRREPAHVSELSADSSHDDDPYFDMNPSALLSPASIPSYLRAEPDGLFPDRALSDSPDVPDDKPHMRKVPMYRETDSNNAPSTTSSATRSGSASCSSRDSLHTDSSKPYIDMSVGSSTSLKDTEMRLDSMRLHDDTPQRHYSVGSRPNKQEKGAAVDQYVEMIRSKDLSGNAKSYSVPHLMPLSLSSNPDLLHLHDEAGRSNRVRRNPAYSTTHNATQHHDWDRPRTASESFGHRPRGATWSQMASRSRSNSHGVKSKSAHISKHTSKDSVQSSGSEYIDMNVGAKADAYVEMSPKDSVHSHRSATRLNSGHHGLRKGSQGGANLTGLPEVTVSQSGKSRHVKSASMDHSQDGSYSFESRDIPIVSNGRRASQPLRIPADRMVTNRSEPFPELSASSEEDLRVRRDGSFSSSKSTSSSRSSLHIPYKFSLTEAGESLTDVVPSTRSAMPKPARVTSYISEESESVSSTPRRTSRASRRSGKQRLTPSGTLTPGSSPRTLSPKPTQNFTDMSPANSSTTVNPEMDQSNYMDMEARGSIRKPREDTTEYMNMSPSSAANNQTGHDAEASRKTSHQQLIPQTQSDYMDMAPGNPTLANPPALSDYMDMTPGNPTPANPPALSDYMDMAPGNPTPANPPALSDFMNMAPGNPTLANPPALSDYMDMTPGNSTPANPPALSDYMDMAPGNPTLANPPALSDYMDMAPGNPTPANPPALSDFMDMSARNATAESTVVDKFATSPEPARTWLANPDYLEMAPRNPASAAASRSGGLKILPKVPKSERMLTALFIDSAEMSPGVPQPVGKRAPVTSPIPVLPLPHHSSKGLASDTDGYADMIPGMAPSFSIPSRSTARPAVSDSISLGVSRRDSDSYAEMEAGSVPRPSNIPEGDKVAGPALSSSLSNVSTGGSAGGSATSGGSGESNSTVIDSSESYSDMQSKPLSSDKVPDKSFSLIRLQSSDDVRGQLQPAACMLRLDSIKSQSGEDMPVGASALASDNITEDILNELIASQDSNTPSAARDSGPMNSPVKTHNFALFSRHISMEGHHGSHIDSDSHLSTIVSEPEPPTTRLRCLIVDDSKWAADARRMPAAPSPKQSDAPVSQPDKIPCLIQQPQHDKERKKAPPLFARMGRPNSDDAKRLSHHESLTEKTIVYADIDHSKNTTPTSTTLPSVEINAATQHYTTIDIKQTAEHNARRQNSSKK